MAESSIKPHAIMVEFLFQGHINPFVNLALALASKGCIVTYVQTELTHHRMSTASAKPESCLFSGAHDSGLDIRRRTISDGFPLDFDLDANFVEFYESIVRDFPARVGELVGEIVESERGRSAPFLVADANYIWPPEVAAEHNIAYVCFWPSPALCLSIGHHFALLHHKLGNSCSDDDSKNEDLPELIRGEKPKNIREYCIKFDPPKEDHPLIPAILLETIIKSQLQVREADLILCNTVEGLESETISTVNQRQKLPTYAIGPTSFLTTTSVSSSLTSEVDCLEWLCSKPPSSVLYVAFGSIAQAETRVIQEIAHGLCGSGVNFLWVLRPDMVTTGDEIDVVLPPQFFDQVSGRGLVVPWCHQRKVLASPAIGGFLTHCGWSSTLESIWYGIPMICYPIFTDQPNIRNLVVYDWEIGINLCDKEEISREEVVEKIQRLMMSDCENEKLKTKMKKANKVVHDAVAQYGSSDRNLDKFLDDLKDKICSMDKNENKSRT